MMSLQGFLLQAEQTLLPQPFFIVLQPSNDLHNPPLDLIQQSHIFPELGAPGLDIPDGISQGQSIGGQSPPSHPSFYAAQDTVDHPGCKYTLLACAQLFFHQDTNLYSSGLLTLSSPSLYTYLRLQWRRCHTLHLTLLNLLRFSSAHFSSLPRSLWVIQKWYSAV